MVTKASLARVITDMHAQRLLLEISTVGNACPTEAAGDLKAGKASLVPTAGRRAVSGLQAQPHVDVLLRRGPPVGHASRIQKYKSTHNLCIYRLRDLSLSLVGDSKIIYVYKYSNRSAGEPGAGRRPPAEPRIMGRSATADARREHRVSDERRYLTKTCQPSCLESCCSRFVNRSRVDV